MCCNSACFSMLVHVLVTVFELRLLLCATWYFTGRQKKEDIFVRLVDSSTKAVSGPSTDYGIGRCVLHCVVSIHTYCMLAAYSMCVCDALILCCVVCHCPMQSLTSMGGLWFPSCSQLRMREQAKALISRGFCWHTCWSAGLYSCYSSVLVRQSHGLLWWMCIYWWGTVCAAFHYHSQPMLSEKILWK